MKTTEVNGKVTVEQVPCTIPDFTVKDLLSSIPAHCYERSALKSGAYVVWDFVLLGAIYKSASFADTFITADIFPNPSIHAFASFALWALYSFAAGLVMTGLWVCAHECGHQAFSESKFINNAVGWVLHSGLGVPYHSWRISHAKHHASTAHMTQDQVFVPKTRSQLDLPAFDAEGENLEGSSISKKAMNELYEAIGDSPIATTIGFLSYLLVGWPMYLIRNASGQKRYPAGTNHFNPRAAIYDERHYGQIVFSDVGIVIWLAAVAYATSQFGFANVFRLYLAPYIWVNHWLVLITFLQHTDPLVPHYRAAEFTFPRGALATLDRDLLGDLGSFMGWIGACTTHGISETHVAHHVASKIPHYNAWEATDALRKRLTQAGISLQGRPGGWAEMYRVFKECKFVEDEGDIVFYKNSKGLAAARPVHNSSEASDSGVEVDNKKSS